MILINFKNKRSKKIIIMKVIDIKNNQSNQLRIPIDKNR
jgi:hypothetical protein